MVNPSQEIADSFSLIGRDDLSGSRSVAKDKT